VPTAHDSGRAGIARCDTVLRGASVVDGTGRDRYRADIGITGDRIAAIGDLSGVRSEVEFDASRYVAAPGFIDIHTHDDRALLSDPGMEAKLSQGITTVVTGNCGVSLSPLVPRGRLPATFDLLGGPEWFRFPDFDSYAGAVDAARPPLNAVALIGHSTLRQGAMADLNRPADESEIKTMQAELGRAMAAGALGLSTGLYYAASRAAPTSEVIALAKVVSAHGGLYTTHMRDEADGVEDSLEETFRIGREADLPVLISHHKLIGPRNFGRSVKTLARIARALKEQAVGLDLYPYAATSTVLDPGRCDGQVKVIVTWSKPHPEMAAKDIVEIAQAWNCSAAAAAERLLPAGAIYFMLDEADVRRILAFPHTMIGSDGLPHDEHPHPRLWGAFPRVLGHYARDLGLLTLEDAVKRMTRLPADYLGLSDRGVLRPDACADIVLFDPAEIIDRATFEKPKAASAGIALVVVNGQVAWDKGGRTPSRSGRMLRRKSRVAAGVPAQ
jgi:N-acyl-D-amino-acid deacylase